MRLAEHPRIVANKDAKGDLGAASTVIARSDLAYYSGDDMLNLPLLSVGAVGVVSVVAHVATARLRRAGPRVPIAATSPRARDLHHELLPVFTGIFRTQGVILTKAALDHLGLPGGPLRLPLADATAEQIAQLVPRPGRRRGRRGSPHDPPASQLGRSTARCPRAACASSRSAASARSAAT